MKKCSECVCYGACVILAKFINSFSEEKNELSPCRNFRPYDPREQITAKWEMDGKFPCCSHCKEHCSRQEKCCPNCGVRMEGEKEASPKPMSDYIERGKVYEMLNALGGCGAEPESWADGWDNAIDTAIDGLNAIPAADVRSERHGEWLPCNDDNKKRCSRCDTICLIAVYPAWKTALFCPHCGAAMMNGKEGNKNG